MSDKKVTEVNAFERKWRHFLRRLKNDPTYRAVSITVVVLVVAISVLVTATLIANRARKQSPDETTGGVETTETPAVTTAPPETAPETEPVDAAPTAYLLPVSGALTKGHDASAQVFSTTMQDYRVHLGVDIATEESAPVCAAAEGVVEKIWEDVRYGQCVAIKHGGDCVTIYKNLAFELAEGVTEGASLAAGALIGAVGDTAMVEIAEDPHLHFEMTVGGLAVDPLDYFDAAAIASLSSDEAYEG